MNQKAQIACNFKYLIGTDGYFNITASHAVLLSIHCRCGHILELMQDRDVATVDH